MWIPDEMLFNNKLKGTPGQKPSLAINVDTCVYKSNSNWYAWESEEEPLETQWNPIKKIKKE